MIEAEHRVIEELGQKRRLLMAANESQKKPVRKLDGVQSSRSFVVLTRALVLRGRGIRFGSSVQGSATSLHRPPCAPRSAALAGSTFTSSSKLVCYNSEKN